MNYDPVDHALMIRYLDPSSSEEDRRRACEYLLHNSEARAYLLEVASQMVHLVDHHKAFVALPFPHSTSEVCPIGHLAAPPQVNELVPASQGSPVLLKFPSRRNVAAGLLLLATLIFTSALTEFRNSKPREAEVPSLQVAEYLGELTVTSGQQRIKTPFQAGLRVKAGDLLESHNWLSWAELKLDSGPTLAVLVNSKVSIRSLTKNRMEVDVISGAVRVHSAKDNPFQFVIRSERLHVTSSGSDTLVWDFSFSRALAASFAGSADVTSADGTLRAHVEPDQMASIGYDEMDFEISGHPEIVHTWSSRGMKPVELGTGIWKEPAQPGSVRLLAAPKNYSYPDGTSHQIQEVMPAVWRRPGMVRLKAGSRLIVTGKYTRQAPVSFVLRTHSDYGKLLDLFIETIKPENLAAPGEPWRVEIPVEAMKSRFKPGQDPIGSLLFNISIYTDEEVGLEVNSIELIAP